MYDLAHRPAAFAVRRVEMLVAQAFHRGAHFGRCSRNLIDRLLAPSRRHFGGHRKLSNRIARVHCDSFLGPPPVFLLTIATAVRTGQCLWCEKASPIWLPAFRLARGGMLQYRSAVYPA